ncbi:MAG: hypothetical protein NT052_00295 [Candidatus Shapirobacteria bacterium]|nr:hypothetical protein [Candidatus Shapirobacteria bacterium]
MSDPAKIAIRASTQEHLEIEDIKDGIVILKDGSSCLVLATTAINFGLLSEKEQEATIYAYAALLNSLNFTVQIVIRSARKDISSYLSLLEERQLKEERKLIKEQIIKYHQFIQEIIQKNNVLDKKFFLIIPMTSLELGVAKTLMKTASQKKGLPFEKNYIVQQAKINLYPKRDHLLRQLARLGLKSHQLESQELIRLFFNIYNPELVSQPMAESSQYKTPIVKTAMPIKPEIKNEIPNQPLAKTQEDLTIRDQINNLVKNGTAIS